MTFATDWAALRHAYGSAAEVPALLAAASSAPPSDEAWQDLWSRLCHQGTVYTASFAALPALAELAERSALQNAAASLSLAAAILASDDVQGGTRDELLTTVAAVVSRLREVCRESLTRPGVAPADFIVLLQAACSFDGDRFWGSELDRLTSGEFPGVCPRCETDLYLVIGEHGFFITAEDWVLGTGATDGPLAVRPGIVRTAIEPNRGELPEDGRKLLGWAAAAGQHEVADRIRYGFGSGVCPECRQAFSIRDAIAAGA